MLKHVTLTRGVSPAPSSSSSASSSSTNEGILSRTGSRLSLSDSATPLRVHCQVLRPDIQYKTVGVTSTTTSEEVVAAILAKCKIRFKDPRLFYLLMEIDIRGHNGTLSNATIDLEDSSMPLQLLDCYPRGQARFILRMKRGGCLVRVFDGSGAIAWQYKSLLISEKTTAGELIDILFRYSSPHNNNHHFSLHIEVNDYYRQLEYEERVLPSQTEVSRWGEVRLVLRAVSSSSSSTLSLYDNVTKTHKWRRKSSSDYELSEAFFV